MTKGRDRPVETRGPAEQALAQSFRGLSATFDVAGLEIEHHPNRSVTLTYRLAVAREGHPAEQWEVTVAWADTSFADVFSSPAPEPDRLDMLVCLVQCEIEEWWHTKRSGGRARKMGRRLG